MNVRVQLFHLTRSGFYRGDEARFGQVQEWCGDFLAWLDEVSNNRINYANTNPFPERQGELSRAIFCVGAVEDSGGNFGVKLWDEGHRTSRGVIWIPEDGPIGTVQAGTVGIPDRGRSGWPSYFWVMPREKQIISFIPEGNATNIACFREYFKNYLRYQSNYVDGPYEVEEEGQTVLKYRYKPYHSEEAASAVTPKVETSQALIYQTEHEILNRWREINRFTLHADSVYIRPDTRGKAQGFLEHLLYGERSSNNDPRPTRTGSITRVEMDWKPQTQDEVREVMEEWTNNFHSDKEWAGVKFDDPNDDRQRRFDKAKCIADVTLEDDLNLEEDEEMWSDDQFKRVWEVAESNVRLLREQASSRD